MISSRRRALLEVIAASFKWLPYSYEYLYHSLIPTTIDGKQVKNKARVNTIYGNSVVENQLVNYVYATNTYNGITFTNNGDGSITISGTATDTISDKAVAKALNIYLISNHYYLKDLTSISGKLTSRVASASSNDNLWKQTSDSPSDRKIYVSIPNGTSFATPFTFFPQLIDLTQMFPFDTPTTLTDNRVQALLNGGYIPYNSGEIKSVDIGEFSTTKADTTALATISFKYQGSGVGTSHDTMEITSSEVVFTKDRALVELGSLSFGSVGNNVWYATLSTTKNDTGLNNMPNIISNKYETVVAKSNSYWTGTETRDKIISLGYDTNRVYVRDTTVTQASDITGTLEYQLATPQVIRIPRRHLGVVDLGSLDYVALSSSVGRFYSIQLQSLVKKPTSSSDNGNIYCSKYSTANIYVSNECLALETNGTLDIRSSAFINKTAIEVKSLLSGIYLFYETQYEVADILYTICVESGGTLTSNSDVLPNVDVKIKCK